MKVLDKKKAPSKMAPRQIWLPIVDKFCNWLQGGNLAENGFFTLVS
jgi:hypothetical protein